MAQSPFAPFFSLVMILWGILFIKFWQRREVSLALHWGTIWVDKHFRRRPEFVGTWRKSPVTGRQELYFASWRRLPRYALSVAVTSALLGFAFFVMILNLNLQVRSDTRLVNDQPVPPNALYSVMQASALRSTDFTDQAAAHVLACAGVHTGQK